MVEAEYKREEFGLARVETALKTAQLTGAQDICRFILDEVQRFTCSEPIHDDITALALVRNLAS